jgi:diguanylate cyclase (GGDEF)-like protein
LTKPSDFKPDRVLEIQEPVPGNQKNIEREVWIFRLLGIVLLFVGWGLITVEHGFGSSTFTVDTMILAGLGVYAFVAAARTRRISVNTEKRLRLGLLVHNMELENLAMQDDLTQLFNRRYFFDRLERELETAQAFKRPLSVIVLDLDAMKSINDTYGHRTGDEVLQHVGRFLLDQTRASDVPARIGGDEFAIILPDTPVPQADALKIRLSKRLATLDLIDRDDLTLKVEASVGCAGFPDTGDTVDDLMQQADSAMYADKHGRRNGTTRGDGEGLTPVPPVFRRAESS